MPHIPRATPPSRAETSPTAAAAEAAEPAAKADQAKKPPRQKIGMSRLSITTFEVDPERVARALFGTEAIIHDDTGELVRAGPAAPSTAGPAPGQS